MARILSATAMLVCAIAAGGCATYPSNNHIGKSTPQAAPAVHSLVDDSPQVKEDDESATIAEDASTQLVAYQQHSDMPVAVPAEPAMLDYETVTESLPTYSLSDFENVALSGNPTLQQAQAQIHAAQGAAYQAGLFPNPIVGYEGEFDRIGAARDETWNGAFISQEVVTGGKLRLSRKKWCQRAQIAQTNYHAQQHRVLNDVRVQFYRTLAAQQLVDVHHELLANGEDDLQTHREMLNVGQTNQPGLLTSEVNLQRDRLNLKQAENELRYAWRTLTSLTGSPELVPGVLTGVIEPEEQPLDWDTALTQLLSSSPELQAAWQKIQHDRTTIERERAEPIPNLLFGLTSVRSPVANTTQTTLNVGLPLPIFDRNQGTVQQAQSDLTQSHAESRRLELELRNRLATQFRDYETSWQRMTDYDSTMLPKAKQAYDLLHDSYKSRRAAWPDVLVIQRQYLTLRAEQIDNHLAYRENDVAIRGMLLTGGLAMPPSPVGAGHIDAVAKPR